MRARTDVRRILVLVNIVLIALLVVSVFRHNPPDVIPREQLRAPHGAPLVPAPARPRQVDPEQRHPPELRRLLPDDPANRVPGATRR